MRKNIWRDCTGEPPGELIDSATALAFLIENARSSVRATPASVMPGLSGVTAPITPESRTTGTTVVPRRSRAGSHSMQLSIRSGHPPRSPRSLNFSVIRLPRINHFLPRNCHSNGWNASCFLFVAKLLKCSGERHENLSADAPDRYNFDSHSLHFCAGTAI